MLDFVLGETLHNFGMGLVVVIAFHTQKIVFFFNLGALPTVLVIEEP